MARRRLRDDVSTERDRQTYYRDELVNNSTALVFRFFLFRFFVMQK